MLCYKRLPETLKKSTTCVTLPHTGESRLAICVTSQSRLPIPKLRTRHVTVIRSHETRVKINQPFKLRFVVRLNCNHIFPWFPPQSPPVSGFLLLLLVLLDDIQVRISFSFLFLFDDSMVSIVCNCRCR